VITEEKSAAPDLPVFNLSAEFSHILDELETGQNLFITGKAGTGKSTLLQLFRRTTDRRVAVLAPTGVAALNIGGQTIHSFFGFPPHLFNSQELKKKKRFQQLFAQLDTLIIDEISMVRADLLDHINYSLQLNLGNTRPFGGLQLVFFGDLFQLPPVVSSAAERQYFSHTYASPYFFAAKVMQHFDFQAIELQKVYRQENRMFLRLLDAIRLNQADSDELEMLNSRHLPAFQSEKHYITLSARNITVDTINRRELAAIEQPTRTYVASIQGDFPASQYPAEAALSLKQDARVMLLRNDPGRQFVNGSLGKVVALTDDVIRVQLEDEDEKQGKMVEVTRVVWEIIRYVFDKNQPDQLSTEVIGSFRQFPLRLAWAVTIHKAQGKTFDRVMVDLGSGAFEHGQTYVALSRCRSLEGVVLRQPLRQRDILVDEQVVDYYQRLFR
jgi:ATP-dependent exoDNAse (exonuclease V) alpha subunit